MIDEWLTLQLRQPAIGSFEYWEAAESSDPLSPSADVLAPDLLNHLVSEEFIARAAAILPPTKLRQFLETRIPKGLMLKRGVFGEVLAARILETYHGHTVPVKKLRFRTASHDSPKGTDVVGITVDSNNRVVSVAYAEVKLRTTKSGLKQLAVIAHDQLKSDCMKEEPEIFGFMVEVLLQNGSSLADAILGYLRDRSIENIDSHHIYLILDDKDWHESHLDELTEHEDLLEPLTLHTIRISDLPAKIDTVYGLVGAKALPDDD